MQDIDTENEVEVLEIETFTQKNGNGPKPKAKHYKIRVDKTNYTVDVQAMTGREILVLAGKNPPEQYKLTMKKHGGAASTIGLDETVDFGEPGVERFMTLRLDQTEG